MLYKVGYNILYMAKKKHKKVKSKMIKEDMDKLVNVKEAAKILGINPETLRRWDRQGKLKTRRHIMNNYRVYKLGEVLALRRKISA